MLVRRVHGKHTLDSFSSVRRMDGREHHVARIGSGKRNLHRLKVTDFAHKEHVRVLTESGTQGVRIRKRIHADFALRNDGLLVPIKVFDRVFNGNDVDGFALVDVIQHGSKRRRLSGTGRSRHKHQATAGQGHVTDNFGQVKFLECGDLRLDMTNHHGNRTALAENVHTETAHVAGTHGKVAFLILFKTQLLVAVHDVVQKGIHHARVDTRIKNLGQRTIDAVNRRNARPDVQVGRLMVDHRTQELFNLQLSHSIRLRTFRGKPSRLPSGGS